MYQIDQPIYFYFLSLLPIIWLGYLLVYRWKIKTQVGGDIDLNYASNFYLKR